MKSRRIFALHRTAGKTVSRLTIIDIFTHFQLYRIQTFIEYTLCSYIQLNYYMLFKHSRKKVNKVTTKKDMNIHINFVTNTIPLLEHDRPGD